MMIAAKPQPRSIPQLKVLQSLSCVAATVSSGPMKRMIAAALLTVSAAAAAPAAAPLYEPVALNIGLSCQWQQHCIGKQERAMKRALKYVRKYEPPKWRIHLCNRNASRKRGRVDWIGFDHCIRNESLRPPPPPRPARKPTRRTR